MSYFGLTLLSKSLFQHTIDSLSLIDFRIFLKLVLNSNFVFEIISKLLLFYYSKFIFIRIFIIATIIAHKDLLWQKYFWFEIVLRFLYFDLSYYYYLPIFLLLFFALINSIYSLTIFG